MRRTAIAAIPVLALLLMPGGASAAHARHALPAKCAPRSHTLLADPQAQLYGTPEGIGGPIINLWACVYGRRRSFFVTSCVTATPSNIPPVECIKDQHVTLAGEFIAYEEADVGGSRYPGIEPQVGEWYVVVRNLRTGRVLHRVPTGTPLKPEPRYAGVGNIVALVLKNDGSVAWIAEDYERSAAAARGMPEEPSYFDVYACDKSGTRLLASGTNIDPSSLALSTGAKGISGYPSSIAGSTLYWMQGGKTMSATLS
jgi:hypothetical protein